MIAAAIAKSEPLVRHITVAEYLDVEIQQGERYQYFDGKIIKMAGGTIRHNRISRNLLTLLESTLEDSFETFGSDQKIFLPKYNFYLYPDAIVVCDTPIMSIKGHAIINPILIVEVLSDSTEDYDKGQKFVEYQSIPTFKEYILVRQDEPEVTVLFREEANLWRSSEISGIDKSVFFRSVGVSLDMKRIYRKVF